MLRRFLFINTIIAIVLCCTAMVEKINDSPKGIIKWSPDRKLTVADFTMVDKLPIVNQVAQSCTGLFIELSHSDTISYKVYAYFDREKSYWCKTISKERGHILQHEQVHFDITHYIANQLKADLKSCKKENEYWKAYDNYMIRLDSMQKLYDKETNFSIDTINQQRWNLYIKKLISK